MPETGIEMVIAGFSIDVPEPYKKSSIIFKVPPACLNLSELRFKLTIIAKRFIYNFFPPLFFYIIICPPCRPLHS
jgi:hypothetical protein